MGKRQAFLDEPVTENKIKHLRIVITDANRDFEYLTVSVDTFKSKFQDSSCIIQKGEHPFIKSTSFVNYKYARVLSFAQIFNGLKQGLFVKKEDVSPELLKRIQDGAKLSKLLDNKYKEWFSLF